ncbi:MAG TPA: DEAD/DEAH box helicase [Jiangellaceae bacterium]
MSTEHPTAGNSARRRPRTRRPERGSAPREAASRGPRAEAAPRAPRAESATAAADTRGFVELGVPPEIASALAAAGIVSPFPIQSATLPDTLAGRDVLGRGQTGSGKTVAFAVPTVSALARSRRTRQARRPRALILVPTRELANQVAATIKPLATAMRLRIATVFGGVGQGPQVAALRDGVDILIACPGRLEDLIGQRHCDLGAVEVTVLDEADHMADLGFLPAVQRLLDATPRGTQRLLFSATLDNGVDKLVRRYLDRPVTHSVAPAVAPVSTMTHHVFAIDGAHKKQVVQELAAGLGRTLLFSRTKHGAKKLAKGLTAAGIPAVDLHGNLSQGARERNLAAFSDGTARVLVATDIAARGIHVDDVTLVVHVDPPAEHKAYLHRSGRTARAGAGGTVVTVMTPDQRGDVRTLARQAGISPIMATVAPGDPAIESLTGPKAPRVEPSRVAPAAPAAGRGGGGRNGGTSGRAADGRDRSGGGSGRGGRSAGSRSGGSRSGGRSGDTRSGDTRSGGSRSGGNPRSSNPRSGGTRSGAPRSSGSGATASRSAAAFSASTSGRSRRRSA